MTKQGNNTQKATAKGSTKKKAKAEEVALSISATKPRRSPRRQQRQAPSNTTTSNASMMKDNDNDDDQQSRRSEEDDQSEAISLKSDPEAKEASTLLSSSSSVSSTRRTETQHSQQLSQASKTVTSVTTLQVLSSSFIERHKSKNDLVKRLQIVVKELSNEDLVPDVDSTPGLDALSALLVNPKYIQHKDKEVRLYTCLACMEIFAIYAPEAPYDPQEVFDIFQQVIAQLGNLAHTTSASQSNYHNYYRLLEHLSEVKTGIVLVEYCRGYSGDPSSKKQQQSSKHKKQSSAAKKENKKRRAEDDNDDEDSATSGSNTDHDDDDEEGVGDDDDENIAAEALELLADLMRVLLESVQLEHLQDVRQHAIDAISACIGEFEHVIPIRILDVLLTPLSRGPKVWVHPAIRQKVNGEIEGTGTTSSNDDKSTKKGSNKTTATTKSKKDKKQQQKVGSLLMAPQLEQVDNVSYIMAVKIIQMTKDKCSTPIASLLNGVLNGDPFTLKLSTIVAIDPADEEDGVTIFGDQGRGGGGGGRKRGPLASTADKNKGDTTAAPNVWNIVYELHRVAPDVLTTVIGTIATNLRSEDEKQRYMIVKLLGRLFYSKHGRIALRFLSCYKEWCCRSQDAITNIRSMMVSCLIETLRTYSTIEGSTAKELRDETCGHLQRMVSFDPNPNVRNDCIHRICDLCYSVPQVIPPYLLRAVGERIKAKQATKSERLDAVTGLAQLYHTHYLRPKLAIVQDMEENILLQGGGGDGKGASDVTNPLATASTKTTVSSSSSMSSSPPTVLLNELDVNSSLIAEVLSFSDGPLASNSLLSSSDGGGMILGGETRGRNRRGLNHRSGFTKNNSTAGTAMILSQKPEEFYFQTPNQKEEQFVWIAPLIMESAWYTDQIDTDMRNRIIQILDDVLWSNPASAGKPSGALFDVPSSASAAAAAASSSSTGQKKAGVGGPVASKTTAATASTANTSHPSKVALSATSRALGFTFVLDSLGKCGSSTSPSNGEGESNNDGGNGAGSNTSSPECTNAYKWLSALFMQRANLQNAVRSYIDARGSIKQHTVDSVDYLKANNVAFNALKHIATLCPTTTNTNDRERLLQQVHSARDRHLFRVLSTIATPNHSMKSRLRAFEDIPKRAKNCSFHQDTTSWIKSCTRRCSMGAINVDMTRHLVLLAQCSLREIVEECKTLDDANVPLVNLTSLLRAITLLSTTFPKMVASCAPEGSSSSSNEGNNVTYFGFLILQEMLMTVRSSIGTGTGTSRSSGLPPKAVQRQLSQQGVLSKLCHIMALVAPYASCCADKSDSGSTGDSSSLLLDETREELVHMCTHEDDEHLVKDCVQILSCDDETHHKDDIFQELFRNFSNGKSLSTKNKRLSAMLVGLSNLTQHFTSQWLRSIVSSENNSQHSGGRRIGVDRVLNFALNDVLRASHQDEEDDDDDDADESSTTDEDEEDDDEDYRGGSSKKRKANKNDSAKQSPTTRRGRSRSASPLSSTSPSTTKRKSSSVSPNPSSLKKLTSATSVQASNICAAMTFLTCHIRTIRDVTNRKNYSNNSGSSSTKTTAATTTNNNNPIDYEDEYKFICFLVDLLNSNGKHPSLPSTRTLLSEAKVAHGRLREVASLSLFRLMGDTSLQLDVKYPSPHIWHAMAKSLLEQDSKIRSTIVKEWIGIVQGTGGGSSGRDHHDQPFNNQRNQKFAPSLSLVSMAVCCADGDQHHLMANGFAGHVHALSNAAKDATTLAIQGLRKTCEVVEAQCSAMGPRGEENWERRFKMKLLPEYSIQFALHFLSHQMETPTVVPDESSSSSSPGRKRKQQQQQQQHGSRSPQGCDGYETKEYLKARYRQLKKRLKWLYEPLITSLGDQADNISFLLQMSDNLGKSFEPIAASENSTEQNKSSEATLHDVQLLQRLRVVCHASREVLMKFVRKDVNLKPYPGAIQIHIGLFQRASAQNVAAALQGASASSSSSFDKGKKKGKRTSSPKASPGSKKQRAGSKRKGRVSFADDTADHSRELLDKSNEKEEDDEDDEEEHVGASLSHLGEDGASTTPSSKNRKRSPKSNSSGSGGGDSIQVPKPQSEDWEMSPIAKSDDGGDGGAVNEKTTTATSSRGSSRSSSRGAKKGSRTSSASSSSATSNEDGKEISKSPPNTRRRTTRSSASSSKEAEQVKIGDSVKENKSDSDDDDDVNEKDDVSPPSSTPSRSSARNRSKGTVLLVQSKTPSKRAKKQEPPISKPGVATKKGPALTVTKNRAVKDVPSTTSTSRSTRRSSASHSSSSVKVTPRSTIDAEEEANDDDDDDDMDFDESDSSVSPAVTTIKKQVAKKAKTRSTKAGSGSSVVETSVEESKIDGTLVATTAKRTPSRKRSSSGSTSTAVSLSGKGSAGGFTPGRRRRRQVNS